MAKGWIWIKKSNSFDCASKIVLYGAGNNISHVVDKYEIEDIVAVVDGDVQKSGDDIILNKRKYIINNIELLSELESKDTFVVITLCDINLCAEIRNEIETRFKQWKKRVISWYELDKGYLDIESAVLLDSNLKERIKYTDISGRLSFYIDEAIKIIKQYITEDLSQIKLFAPSGGSRLSLIIRYGEQRFIIFFPDNRDYEYFSEDNIKKCSAIIEKLGINKSILIYDNYSGMRLYKFVDNEVDWTQKKDVVMALKTIKKVHESGYSTNINNNLWGEIDSIVTEIGGSQLDTKKHSVIFGEIREETTKNINALIHGDFSYGNIIKTGNDIEIVDWEFMCMGDAMFDVVYFYFRIRSIFPCDLEEILTLYFERRPTSEEIKHAQAWLCTIVYWQYIENIRMKNTEVALDLEKEITTQLGKYIG